MVVEAQGQAVSKGPVRPEADLEDVSFEWWYRTEHHRVVAVVAALVNDREVAADVTDEAFARALARWDRVRAMDQPSAWVYRVAVNLAKRRAVRLRMEQRLLMRRTTPFVDPGTRPPKCGRRWAPCLPASAWPSSCATSTTSPRRTWPR
jgi:DNA-directed RNA polymerase specialized sigma24 family protein